MRGHNTAQRLGYNEAGQTPSRITLSPLRAVEGGNGLERDAFRQAVLRKLASHALRTGGAAHDINNPCASVTANLSFLALRLEDLARRSESIVDPDLKADLIAIHNDIKEVTEESGEAMKRIAELTRGLVQPNLRTAAPEKVVDISEIARRAVRLLSQCVKEITITFRGDPAYVLASPNDLGDVVLDMVITSIEDGRANDETRPGTVEIETRKAMDSDKFILKVTRSAGRGYPPRLDRELRSANETISKLGGTLEVNENGKDYSVIASFDAPAA